MKITIQFLMMFLIVFASCKQEKSQKKEIVTKEITTKNKEVSYTSFGAKFSEENSLSSINALAKMKNLQVGDTIQLKFASTIKEVCSKKGCWMKLPLKDSVETMVRFKDYGFFMPLDSQGREVIVNGKAFLKETSVKELQHYAEDAGKSSEEIAKIVAPKREFTFEADGVLMKELEKKTLK